MEGEGFIFAACHLTEMNSKCLKWGFLSWINTGLVRPHRMLGTISFSTAEAEGQQAMRTVTNH